MNVSALALAAAAVWLQSIPDMRSLSWWLPHGGARELAWLLVFIGNLAVLVGFLYWVLFRGKNFSIPGSLRTRGEGIQQQLREAEAAHQDAQARLAAIEARIAGLPAEVEALRAEGEAEAAAEYRRLVEASRSEAAQLIHLGQQEIAAAGRLAEKELNALAAGLALDLASKRLKERLTGELDRELVRAAAADMATPAGAGAPN